MNNKKILVILFLIGFLASVIQAVVAPINLTFNENATSTYDEGNFSLNWTAGDEDSAINYTIYIYSNNSLYLKDGNSSALGYKFDNLTEANYTFVVAALNASGEEGANSSNISIYVDSVAPAAPTELNFAGNDTATYDYDGTFSVNWTAGENLEKNYSIYISVGGNLFAKVTNNSATGYSYTNLTEGNYSFNISGVDVLGREGTNSSTVYMNVDLPYPTAPTALTFGRNTSAAYDEGAFSVNWTAGIGGDAVKNYSIYIFVGGTLFRKDVNNSITGYNYTNTTAGNYSFTVAGVNATGTEGTNSSNISIYIDRTAPVVSLVSPADNTDTSTTSQRFRFNVTDNKGIKNCSLYIDDDLEETETSVENNTNTYFDSVSLDGSASGIAYDWYVRCYDYGGNYDDSSEWTITITEDDDDDAGGSSSSTDFWTSGTYSASSSSLESGYVKELAAKSRIRLTVGGSTHYVGLISLTSTTAKINVSSTPQQATFNIGDEKKFEVTGDTYYDILVKLVSISNSKANVSVKSINEKMPSLGGTQTDTSLETTGQNKTTSAGDEEGDTTIPVGRLVWIIVVVSVSTVLITLGYYLMERRRKRFGY